MCYNGPKNKALDYFKSIGYAIPPQTNPAECEFFFLVTCFHTFSIYSHSHFFSQHHYLCFTKMPMY